MSPNYQAKPDWSLARTVPVTHANVVMIQGYTDGVLFTFGQFSPPVETANMDPKRTQQFFDENAVPIVGVTRMLVSEEVAKGIMENLKANLGQPAEEE